MSDDAFGAEPNATQGVCPRGDAHMDVYLGQIYAEAGASLPFSHVMQVWLGTELSRSAKPSPCFQEKYGADFSVILRVNAVTGSATTEICGPQVFRRRSSTQSFFPTTRFARRTTVAALPSRTCSMGWSSSSRDLESSAKACERKETASPTIFPPTRPCCASLGQQPAVNVGRGSFRALDSWNGVPAGVGSTANLDPHTDAEM